MDFIDCIDFQNYLWVTSKILNLYDFWMYIHNCVFRCRFIITITSNEPWNTQTHKTDRNPPITNHKPWPFEPVKVKFCFLRGPLRWLTAAKNAIVSWLLNFRIRIFVKSAVIDEPSKGAIHSTKIPTGPTRKSGPSQKVDPFFRNFSGWTEPILWVLDRNFRKFWLNGSRP